MPFKGLENGWEPLDIQSDLKRLLLALSARPVRATRSGYPHRTDLAKLKAWLSERASTALPQTVTVLIDELASRAGEVKVTPCTALVEVKDPNVLKSRDEPGGSGASRRDED